MHRYQYQSLIAPEFYKALKCKRGSAPVIFESLDKAWSAHKPGQSIIDMSLNLAILHAALAQIQVKLCMAILINQINLKTHFVYQVFVSRWQREITHGPMW